MPPPSSAAAVTAESLIARFRLQPHPEGGYYARTYSSTHSLATPHPSLPSTFTQYPRPLATTILFLLTRTSPTSTLHRIPQAEHWTHLAGDPLTVVQLDPAHPHHQPLHRTIGHVREGWEPQVVVEGGQWFGALWGAHGQEGEEGVGEEGGVGYALVSCAVYGSFFFEEFELGEREQLLRLFPMHAAVVRRMCRAPEGSEET